MDYLNEHDPFAAEWVRNLSAAGHIPETHVDQRDIQSVQPADLVGFRHCHFFGGVSGWPLALKLAGWGDRPIWTGSCPCQPFSCAGKGHGTKDERHLWPDFFRLIRECRPAIVVGEQVASKDALAWLDGVFADLEGAGYACGAVDMCAAGVSAPHIRQRLFWLGITADARLEGFWAKCGLEQGSFSRETCGSGGDVRLGDSERDGLRSGGRATANESHESGHWEIFDLIPSRDGVYRRIESGTFPLAHGIPRDVAPLLTRMERLGIDAKTARGIIKRCRANRTGRLRGYGNAIVPQVAAEFIRAVMEIINQY